MIEFLGFAVDAPSERVHPVRVPLLTAFEHDLSGSRVKVGERNLVIVVDVRENRRQFIIENREAALNWTGTHQQKLELHLTYRPHEPDVDRLVVDARPPPVESHRFGLHFVRLRLTRFDRIERIDAFLQYGRHRLCVLFERDAEFVENLRFSIYHPVVVRSTFDEIISPFAHLQKLVVESFRQFVPSVQKFAIDESRFSSVDRVSPGRFLLLVVNGRRRRRRRRRCSTGRFERRSEPIARPLGVGDDNRETKDQQRPNGGKPVPPHRRRNRG